MLFCIDLAILPSYFCPINSQKNNRYEKNHFSIITVFDVAGEYLCTTAGLG